MTELRFAVGRLPRQSARTAPKGGYLMMKCRNACTILLACTFSQFATAEDRVPCSPSKPLASAVQYDPFYYSRMASFQREQGKGPCKYTVKVAPGASWFSSKVVEADMTAEAYKSCLSATKRRPHVALVATVQSASDRHKWFTAFGGKGSAASFGSEVGKEAASSGGSEVLEEIGDAILTKAGTLAFFVIDVAKVAVENSCYGKTSSAGKASIEQLLALGGRFYYEQRIVPRMASNLRPALLQTAYYRAFIGDPGSGLGEWRVVPLFASALPVNVK